MSTVRVSVDGKVYDAPEHFMHKSTMLSDVPNFVYTLGYSNYSWTLKVSSRTPNCFGTTEPPRPSPQSDLVSARVCRLLRYMDAHGYTTVCPRIRGSEIQTSENRLLGLTSG